MIDLSAERIVSILRAAELLPQRRQGRSIHVSTLYRWIHHGTGGVRLESIKVGGALYTSVEALQRFAERCSGGAPNSCPTNQRKRQIARAEEQLQRDGI